MESNKKEAFDQLDMLRKKYDSNNDNSDIIDFLVEKIDIKLVVEYFTNIIDLEVELLNIDMEKVSFLGILEDEKMLEIKLLFLEEIGTSEEDMIYFDLLDDEIKTYKESESDKDFDYRENKTQRENKSKIICSQTQRKRKIKKIDKSE